MKRNVEIYARLRYEREKLGLEQDTIAKIIGCSKSNYCNKELGVVPWRLRECFIIRDFINKALICRGEEAITIDTLFFASHVSKTTQKRKLKTG